MLEMSHWQSNHLDLNPQDYNGQANIRKDKYASRYNHYGPQDYTLCIYLLWQAPQHGWLPYTI